MMRRFVRTRRFGTRADVDETVLVVPGKTLIGGEWVGAQKRAVFPVFDPATGDVVGSAPDMGAAETEIAIDAASSALESWRRTSPRDRSRRLRQWHDSIVERREELARLMTLECGKPLAEARGEVDYGASFVEWFAEEGPRCVGSVDASCSDRRMLTTRQAVGCAGLITPWNFPLGMITRKAGAALAAGCTVVVKPAEDTPLTALALAKLAEGALPPGALNVVTAARANAPAVGEVLCASPVVRALSFTGSTEVGKRLYAQCAGTVKKLGLELGGNAPFVVLDDADLDLAVECAMASKFRYSGQTCVCADRFLVHDAVFDDFEDRLLRAIRKLEIGRGLDDGVTLGPLINQRAADRVRSLIPDDAAVFDKHAAAARALGPTFVAPALVRVDLDLDHPPPCWDNENFGPVVPLARFRGDDDAVIEIANRHATGLAAYVVAGDLRRAWRIAERLETGMCGVNQGIISTATMPFGGVKESGIGREGGIGFGISEYLEDKYLCFGNLHF